MKMEETYELYCQDVLGMQAVPRDDKPRKLLLR